MHWLGCILVKRSENSNISAYSQFLKFEIQIYLYFVYLPAVIPGCARCRAPEISHDKGNGGGFMKTLYDLPTVPLSFFLDVNLTFKGDDSLLRLLLIMSHK